MKTRTKALLLTLCAALLVCATVLATMAFLTATDSVKNTFTVGNVAITLDEAEVDANGQAVTPENRVDANQYKLIPGKAYTKDPTIHVATGSEDCWLFVKLENGLVDITGATTIENQMTAKGWAVIDATKNIYAYRSIASADDDVVVFETFTLTKDAAVEDYETAEIVVTAYAVQADGFTSAADAWAAAGLE
jgi:sipW-cognate class signal peptide